MNERTGTAGGAGMDEAAGMDDGAPMGAAEAAVIMRQAGERARRQLRVSHRATFTIWGLGLLLGYGTDWRRCSRWRARWPMPGPAAR
jgi:hypothetical protein